jgi:hypothetical protein
MEKMATLSEPEGKCLTFSPPSSPKISQKNKVRQAAQSILEKSSVGTAASSDSRFHSPPLHAALLRNQEEAAVLKSKKTAAFKARVCLSTLFSSRSFAKVPFNYSSMAAYLYKNRRGLGASFEFAFECFYDNEGCFLLAHSLLDRFLEKHPFMKSENYLPALRYTALVIAVKYFEDHCVFNSDLLEVLPQDDLTFEKLNKMEAVFLKELDWVVEEI